MHFRIPQPEFARLLQAVQGVVERKSTMRILECVLLEAESRSLQVVATDLDVGVRQRREAEVLEPGSVCLPARKLNEIVRLLSPQTVEVRSKEAGRVELRCGASIFRIVGLGREEFPSLPQVGEDALVKLPRQALGEMIDRVFFAITNDDSRYALNGCLLSVRKGAVRMVSSDGHRLAFVERVMEGADPSPKAIEVIVPKKTIGELARLCSEEQGETVDFAHKDNQVLFRCGERALISRLLEGQFPNYERVIPKENENVFEVDAVRLGEAVRRVALLASEHSRAVRLAVAPGKVEISASSPEQGEAREVLDVAYKGPAIHVGFNARYMLDFIEAAGSEQISVALRDKDTQGLLRPVGRKEEDYRYVVMPMRLEEPEEAPAGNPGVQT